KTIHLNAELLIENFYNDPIYGALIRITFEDKEWRFIAEVQKNLTKAVIGVTAHRLLNYPTEGPKVILVTRHVTPNIYSAKLNQATHAELNQAVYSHED
ncbi:MAG: hypothetical protein ACYSWW_20780, partial [Planctomycetota bacterium]